MSRSKQVVRVLSAGWVAGVLVVAWVAAAYAVPPQAWVTAEEQHWLDVAGDAMPAVPSLWDRGYTLNYQVMGGTVQGAAISITQPNGIEDVWIDTPGTIGWQSGTSTFGWQAVGPLSGSAFECIDALPSQVTLTPSFSMTRHISNPVLGSDSETRTLTFGVTIASSMAGYDWMRVDMLTDWNAPDGLSYSVVSTSGPAGFTHQSWGLATYSADNPATLGVGSTYEFTADVQITRSGDLAQAALGDLYLKPSGNARYGNSTPVAPVTGNSISVAVGAGVTATFASTNVTNFSGQGGQAQSLDFNTVATGVGPIALNEVSLVRNKRTSISGTTLYAFDVELQGTNVAAATLTTPGANVYAMEMDEGYTEFWRASTTEADLSDFGPGTYRIDLTGTDGGVQTYYVDLPDATYPAAAPQFDQSIGFETLDPRPLLSWQAAGPGVDAISFELWSVDDEYEGWEMLGTGVTSSTPGEDLGIGGYVACVEFFDGEVGALPGGATCYTGWVASTDTYFNITPEPVTLALLGLGAGGLLLRRRRN